MRSIDLAGLLEAVAAEFRLGFEDSMHGRRHITNVIRNGLSFSKHLEGVDRDVLLVACAGHDACRTAEHGGDIHHGRRASDWLKSLGARYFDFDAKRMTLLRDIVGRHADGAVGDTPTADALFSSDRADLCREGVWITPSSRFFTAASWDVYQTHIRPLYIEKAVA